MLDLPSLLFVGAFRDWVIIVTGIIIGAFFFVLLILTVVLGLLAKALLGKVSSLLDESVKPLMGTAQQTADRVKGTTSFLSGAAVTPVVRTYGVVAGVRRAVGVIAGLTGAGGPPPKR
ncbi:MAG: hypothetical protein IVW36_05060 [Dehalococcoidia bacterium]|nr:hypothetical protein [Dehalococcoidia bacterium]